MSSQQWNVTSESDPSQNTSVFFTTNLDSDYVRASLLGDGCPDDIVVAPWGPYYETELRDGRKIVAQIQGSGGVIKVDVRLRWILKDPDGEVSLWTDPTNDVSTDRLTTVDINDIVAVRFHGRKIWPNQED